MANLTPEEQAQLEALLAKQSGEPPSTLTPVELPPPPEAPAAGDWQPQDESGAPTAPPPTAPADPAQAAQAANPEETISPTTFETVAVDGATEKTTPVFSTVPCPVCGNTTLKTTNVDSATPLATLKGDTVNPGDQVVLCDSCRTTVTAGDIDAYEQQAQQGVFGADVQARAQGENAATVELDDERAQIERERATLNDRIAALEQREQALTAQQEQIAEANKPAAAAATNVEPQTVAETVVTEPPATAETTETTETTEGGGPDGLS